MSKKKTRRIKRRKANRRQDPGDKFEHSIARFFNKYMDDYGMTGIAYVYPVIHDYVQHIDVMVDSLILGYIGIECKSISEKNRGNKIMFKSIINTNRDGMSQVERQHLFLDCAGRYGIMAFELRGMNEAFLLPHRYVVDRWNEGNRYITINEIIENSYRIGSPGDLVKFVRNKCW